MRDEEELAAILRRIDGRGYKAYQDLRGSHRIGSVELFVDHVQGDPFAAPSRMRVRLPLGETGFRAETFRGDVRRVAFEDLLARRVRRAARALRPGTRGSGKSGEVSIDAGGQPVLERTAAKATGEWVEARLAVGLPAAGRRVLGREALGLLRDDLPRLAREGLCEGDRQAETEGFLDCAQNHRALQSQLAEHGLVAFLADGSLLPRQSGASEAPMREGAVRLRAPESLRVELELPCTVDGTSRVAGLGIREGVTLIVGGGYHGKSTLLRAIERGIHPHVPGDGREQVATLGSAVKVRAEDGRRVVGCDIHGFIADLPGGRSTRSFDSDDASGSTSQAAGIVEAIEAGASALLIDEDTSATNFMVRDARMQALVARDREPITPFVDRVRELWEGQGVSTVLVMGGSGDYFDVADTVIEMAEYVPRDVTRAAREIASRTATNRESDARRPLRPSIPRVPVAASVDPSKGRRDVHVEVRGLFELGFGTERVDLRALEQLVDPSQTRAIGHALAFAARRIMEPGRDVPEVLDALDALLDEDGLDALGARGDLARPRRFEIAAALSRLRSLRVEAR
ncbi:MAG: ABC-ATPase domain-containing protein [Myxococcota bacterium]|nr:ABC-ATPase domain-containing protein [Myxococcota bacterium]